MGSTRTVGCSLVSPVAKDVRTFSRWPSLPHTPLTSAALAGQATSCIGAEPVSLLLALISYSIGIGHEYKVQNMAKSPMLCLWWWTLRLTYFSLSAQRRSWDDLKWVEH